MAFPSRLGVLKLFEFAGFLISTRLDSGTKESYLEHDTGICANNGGYQYRHDL